MSDADAAAKPVSDGGGKSARAPLPHSLVLILAISSVVIGVAGSITAILNYTEARRNNLQPGVPSVTAFLIRSPHGLDYGEFEFFIKNDGKTSVRDAKIRRAVGVALRPSYGRGGSDPDRVEALKIASSYDERVATLEKIAAIAERQSSVRERAPTADLLEAGQVVSLRMRGYILNDAFENVIAKEKGYLVIAGTITYLTLSGGTEQRPFCFERHPPFTAPAQKEPLSLCTEGSVFLFQ